MDFNAKEHTGKIIEFIRKYFEDNHLGGVIIGISGGKDSGVVAGLFTKALGAENVIGVTMPCHSHSTDATDAKLVSDKYGFKYQFSNKDIFPIFSEKSISIFFGMSIL